MKVAMNSYSLSLICISVEPPWPNPSTKVNRYEAEVAQVRVAGGVISRVEKLRKQGLKA